MCSIAFKYTIPQRAEIIKEKTLLALLISFNLHIFRGCSQNFITLQCLTPKSPHLPSMNNQLSWISLVQKLNPVSHLIDSRFLRSFNCNPHIFPYNISFYRSGLLLYWLSHWEVTILHWSMPLPSSRWCFLFWILMQLSPGCNSLRAVDFPFIFSLPHIPSRS